MKNIINNPNNLNEENIVESTNKVRAIILNDLQVTLVDYANMLMFPGGKVKLNESEMQALKRELKEELGLDINNDNIIPFVEYKNYLYNYPTKNSNKINRLVTTKYYIIRSVNSINLSKNSLTENEKNNNFNVINEDILLIDGLIKNYCSNNPRWQYFKKELTDIFYELRYIFKEELEKEFYKCVQDPNSWDYTPDRTIYMDKDNLIRLIKTNEKVVD